MGFYRPALLMACLATAFLGAPAVATCPHDVYDCAQSVPGVVPLPSAGAHYSVTLGAGHETLVASMDTYGGTDAGHPTHGIVNYTLSSYTTGDPVVVVTIDLSSASGVQWKEGPSQRYHFDPAVHGHPKGSFAFDIDAAAKHLFMPVLFTVEESNGTRAMDARVLSMDLQTSGLVVTPVSASTAWVVPALLGVVLGAVACALVLRMGNAPKAPKP